MLEARRSIKKLIGIFILVALPSSVHATGYLLSAHGPASYVASTTSYLMAGVTLTGKTVSEVQAQVPFRVAGTLSGLWVMVTANSVTATSTFTIRINGTNGTQTISVPASTTGEFHDITHSDIINAGDKIDIQLVTGSSGGSISIVGYAMVYTVTPNSTLIMVDGMGDTGPSGSSNGFATYYEPISGIMGAGGAWSVQTESQNQYKMKTAGTFANMAVYVSSNASTAAITFRFRKNGANGNQVISVGAGQTGLFEDNSNTDTVIVGDTVCYSIAMAPSSDGKLIQTTFIKDEFTTTGNDMEYPAQTQGHSIAAGQDFFSPIQGALGFDSAELNDYQVLSQVTGTLSKMHAYIQSNTLTQGATIQMRVNRANGNQIIYIPAGGTGYYEDSTHTDAVTTASELDYRISAGAGAGSAPFNYVGAVMTTVPSSNKLTTFWAGNGSYKMTRQDRFPNGTCSTCTITRNWDGTTVKLFGAKNETVSGVLYMGNGGGGDAAGVTFSISSFSRTGGGTGIVSTAVLLPSVTDYTTRPVEVFYVRYLPIKGLTQLSWDGTEYEQRDLPERFRRPYTVSASSQGIANVGTLWTDRQDHDKFYPEILVPYEAVATSGFTVSSSSSQAIWFDVYISTSLTGNSTYTATITVQEGISISTTIPVSLYVYNFTLPDSPSLKTAINISGYDINFRHQGLHFPGVSCSSCPTTRDHYAQLLHRHKFSATTGDSQANYCSSTSAQPCPEYVRRLDGSLYNATSGYANAPGVNTGDQAYFIGTYGQWSSAQWSTSTATGVNGFCTNISSWSTYMGSNFPTVKPYLYLSDEASTTTLLNTEKWATWMSTSCTMAGSQIRSFATVSLTTAAVISPHLNTPASTFNVGSSVTWATLASQYETSSSTQFWNYNSHPSAVGSTFATEDDGIAPTSIFWAMWKKGINGWFFWQATNWNDQNNADNENDLFNVAKTFGYFTSTSTIKGYTGSGFSNGDGVLVYPGTDLTFPSDSYGFDGPIASWRLKMLRRGIQDGDYLTLAYAISASSTTSIVSTLMPKVLWEYGCFDASDCTYVYGGRSWTNDPNTWEVARESLAQIVANAPVATASGNIKGRLKFMGRIKIK